MRLFKYTLITALLSTMGIIGTAHAVDNNNPGPAHHPIHIFPRPANAKDGPIGLTPQDVRKAYGIDQLPNRGLGGQGEGQTIALIVAYDDPAIESDLAIFNNQFGLSACTTANGCFRKVYASGSPPQMDAGWSAEVALDVEWSHAIAPKARIILVEAKTAMAPDLDQAIQVAVNQWHANIVSMSWGNKEYAGQLARDVNFMNPYVTFIASSGDSGHGVSYPATSPYVLSVGGTVLMPWPTPSETAWAGSGGGLSALEKEPDYQKSYPVPNNPTQMRAVPDVGYNAGMGMAVYNSIPDPQSGTKGWQPIGGTSAGSPQWAGLIADANSIVHRSIPNMTSLVYKISSRSRKYTYNDIVSGNNGTCDYYCQARADYNYITGLGSPKALLLVNRMISGGVSNS